MISAHKIYKGNRKGQWANYSGYIMSGRVLGMIRFLGLQGRSVDLTIITSRMQ